MCTFNSLRVHPNALLGFTPADLPHLWPCLPRRQLAGALSTADKDMDRLRVEVRELQQQVRSAETLLLQERTSNDELTAQKDSLRSKLGSAQEQLKASVLMMQ